MNEDDATRTTLPAAVEDAATATVPAPACDILTDILPDGAQRPLAQAVDAEVLDWIDPRGFTGAGPTDRADYTWAGGLRNTLRVPMWMNARQ